MAERINPPNLSSSEALKVALQICDSLDEESIEANIVVYNKDTMLVTIRMDNTRPSTRTVADLKAKVSATTGKPTEVVAQQIQSGEIAPAMFGLQLSDIIPYQGGLPIYSSETGELLGGAGVSNLAQEDDRRHCEAGIIAAGFRTTPIS